MLSPSSDRRAADHADDVIRGLSSVADLLVVPDPRLADLTTLRIGGRPRALLECATAEAVTAAVGALDAAGVPVLVLGGGSNLVVAGGDLDVVVVAVRNSEVGYREADPGEAGPGQANPGGADSGGTGPGESVSGGIIVRAGAGLNWDDLVADTVGRGYGGLECLSGIPGSVGATPVQNVGAYGVEVAQVLHRVRWYDRGTGTDEWVLPAALGLSYRTSVLKNSDRAVVLEVEFRLDPAGRSEPIRYAELAGRLGVAPGERADPALVRRTVLELRRGKGMVLDDDDEDTWSAGSFFTNPVVREDELPTVRSRVTDRLGAEQAAQMPAFAAAGGVKLSAGWLIERAGFGKGHPSSSSPARLSTKHTLALTNRGSATADDVIALAREVRDGVREAFGVELHPEPVWVGCSI
ncbi:UDP-N-acetylmuramate dehydrogenase [Dietzia psychralcaliphila]|uniref:UDP-N-acetylmuramate dehydrogenase n=2 Tax=Dietzia psychralcaliphila TaxID=139021 RepID=UPI000D308F29|nr:UDP-N-acetylmuramate dehydrogenase [Dietzia psychralcaliphila]PTM90358.1 UDP-N-acetylmuramate dehydrogenase [Dietzia psychralcaliphila]